MNKKPYYIFTKGNRKIAFRIKESECGDWRAWTRKAQLLTLKQANNINDADLYELSGYK